MDKIWLKKPLLNQDSIIDRVANNSTFIRRGLGRPFGGRHFVLTPTLYAGGIAVLRMEYLAHRRLK